jgi:hypothetical protein
MNPLAADSVLPSTSRFTGMPRPATNYGCAGWRSPHRFLRGASARIPRAAGRELDAGPLSPRNRHRSPQRRTLPAAFGKASAFAAGKKRKSHRSRFSCQSIARGAQGRIRPARFVVPLDRSNNSNHTGVKGQLHLDAEGPLGRRSSGLESWAQCCRSGKESSGFITRTGRQTRFRVWWRYEHASVRTQPWYRTVCDDHPL